MFSQLSSGEALIAFLGAGGLAALSATITKYLLDRRKLDTDHDSGLLGRMQQRIDGLELKERECMERNTEMAQRIGYLEAKVESLEYQLKNNEASVAHSIKMVAESKGSS